MRTVQSDRHITLWLYLCAITVFCMVVLGGVTRLTGSGLSMVDWRPIMGVVPPLTEAQWLDTFAEYKKFPEYQKVNAGMSLPAFKTIFWYEYSHRVLGRFIGLLFALPFCYFLLRRKLDGPLTGKLTALLVLGGLQGLMGWYMVQSGLVDDPRVSQYRLTAHLGLAIIIFMSLLWVAWSVRFSERSGPRDGAAFAVTGVALMTMLSGGFVAGMDAGLLFGTWPLMGDTFFPLGLYAAGLIAAFEDPVTIQFNHRMLAYLTAAVVVWFVATRLRRRNAPTWALWALLAVLTVQIVLGIANILMRVPVPLAAIHQAVGLMLLATSLYVAHRSTR